MTLRIDSDVLAKPGRVDVRARDPKQRKTITAAGSDAEARELTEQLGVAVGDPDEPAAGAGGERRERDL